LRGWGRFYGRKPIGSELPGQAGGLWLLWTATTPLLACRCQLTLDVCAETQYSNVVFVGTVESITPEFLTRWKPASRPPVDSVNKALEQYQRDGSPARVSALKDAVRTAFAGLGEENRRRLEAASDLRALADLFGSVLDGTRQIHFRVRTLFRKADDDDADDDYDPPDTLDVMTPFGDCGNDFQVGETYLVYANVSLAVFLTGCSKTADHGAGKSPSAAAYFKVDAATAGTISGSILYLGSRPARRAIDVSGDPACEAANHDAPGPVVTTSEGRGTDRFAGGDLG